MKRIKRLFAIMLAACLVFTNAVPSFAEVKQEPIMEQVAEVQENATEAEEADEATPSEAEYKEFIVEDDIEEEAVIEEAEDDEEFIRVAVVDGIKVTLTADPGVFPKDAKLSVKKVSNKEAKKEIEEAVEEARDEEANVASKFVFDIKMLVDGEEVQPDTSKGEVKITFTLAEKVSENLEANVYHLVADEEENLTAEVLETEVETVAVEETDEIEEVTEISSPIESFSYYVVEFTYNELQYVLQGDSEVKLSAILNELGINGKVTAAEVSDEKLFTVKKDTEGDDWTVAAINAFSTEEWMKVTIDEQEYEIVVMDDGTDVPPVSLTIKNIKAQQRWPWNGYVDISFDLIGEEDDMICLIEVSVIENGAVKATAVTNVLCSSGEGSFYWNLMSGGNDPRLDENYYSESAKIRLTASVSGDNPKTASAESEAITLDLRTSITLDDVEIADVVYDDTAWGNAPKENVTIGYMNGGDLDDKGDIISGLSSNGKTDVSLPKKSGTYRLIHSAGELSSFVAFTVTGYKEIYVAATGNDTTGDGSMTNPYATVGKAFTEAGNKSATVHLLSDVTTWASPSAGQDITLDLGGYTFMTSCTTNSLVQGASLTIDDTSSGKNGKFVNTSGRAMENSGILTLKAGTITGSTEGYKSTWVGGGVYNYEWATFNMEGGSISGCKSAGAGGGVYNKGTFNMTDGSITNCKGIGGGVYNDGIFNMSGGSISGCVGTGGGVYNMNTFNMSDGTITGCSTDNQTDGGAVYVCNGSFTMNGGSITNNTATKGGGVCIAYGTVVLGGVAKITDNKGTGADATDNLYIASGNIVTLGKGENAPSDDMSVGVTMQTPGVFTDAADGYINHFSADDSTNYKIIYTTEKKLKLATKYDVAVESGIENGTVTTNAANNQAFEGDTVIITVTPDAGYKLVEDSLKATYGSTPMELTLTQDAQDTTKYTFTMPEDNVTITAEFEEVPLNNFAALAKAMAGEDQATIADVFEVNDDAQTGTRTIRLLTDITASSSDPDLSVPEGKKIVLDLNDHTIAKASAVKVKGDLTLTDSSESKSGKITTSESAEVQSRGIEVTDGGTFTMNGGSITGNSANDEFGGGVLVYGNSTFTMNGGSITNNSANYGGGVFVYSYGNLTMTGGSITGNSSTCEGGGVKTGTNSIFNMTGGSITENTSADNGGGVIIAGTIILGGTAKITDNKKGTGTGATDNNLYLGDGKTVTLATGGNVPASGMSIGITTESAPEVESPVAITGTGVSENDKQYFFADKSDEAVVAYREGQLWLFNNKGSFNITYTGDGVTFLGVDGDLMRSANADESVTFTLTVDSGVDYESIEVSGKDSTGANVEVITMATSTYVGYRFTMPEADVTVTAKLVSPDPKPDPKPSKKSNTASSTLFTGTWNNAVSNGTWTQDANGVWHYGTTATFRNTWGYIVNPYANAGQNQADWFWFDANGNMLTGWQQINGKWYYLNPTKDGTLGACLIGPARTPDGYEVDESGAWTGNGTAPGPDNSNGLFTGTPGNPVTDGNWSIDANGNWHYTSSQQFRNTWAYIYNPYAHDGQNTSDWFWFDEKGNMLTGWQKINGKWYYLHPTKDGVLGSCYIGPGKTPDGYEIDASGARTGR